MIKMNEEELVRIQKILTWSDIHPSDCTKINDLITRFSKENKQLQNNWNELKKCIREWILYHSVCEEDYKELNVLEDVESKMQELEGNNE